MDTEKRELWDRLNTEPERAYGAFEVFLSLPSGERKMLAGLQATYRQSGGCQTQRQAYEIDPRARTPFAVVTFFEPTLHRTLAAPTDFDGFCALLDWLVGEESPCCAVRLDGRFGYVKTRSVPRQRKPYPPLAEVVRRQPTFELRDVPGSVVGFRFPRYAQGLNVAGYHFHFITEDRGAGGHVLGFRLASGELSVDREADLRLELPDGVDLPAPDLSAAKGEELDRIEGSVARVGQRQNNIGCQKPRLTSPSGLLRRVAPGRPPASTRDHNV